MRYMFQNTLAAYMRYGSRDANTGAYTTQYSDPVTLTGSLQPIKGGDVLTLTPSGSDYTQASKKLYLKRLPDFQDVATEDKTDDVLYWDGGRWYEVIQSENNSIQARGPRHHKLLLSELDSEPPLTPPLIEPM